MHVVKLACERPELRGRSLSTWDCREIARELVRAGIVATISATSVRRVLAHNRLKPWRTHMWLSSNVPRDDAFVARVRDLCELYTRPLAPGEAVLSIDEKTSIQPRPRLSETKPARRGSPVRVEHEYRRDGALNLIAAFNTRTGKVIGRCYERKRQDEFIDFLEAVDLEMPADVHTIHVVLDNVSVHKGKRVKAWLAAHPRFRFFFTPVHCSWMNQVEQCSASSSASGCALWTSRRSPSCKPRSCRLSASTITTHIRSTGPRSRSRR
jgi:hypothetical protein